MKILNYLKSKSSPSFSSSILLLLNLMYFFATSILARNHIFIVCGCPVSRLINIQTIGMKYTELLNYWRKSFWIKINLLVKVTSILMYFISKFNYTSLTSSHLSLSNLWINVANIAKRRNFFIFSEDLITRAQK